MNISLTFLKEEEHVAQLIGEICTALQEQATSIVKLEATEYVNGYTGDEDGDDMDTDDDAMDID
ncbi:hypothetical protein N7490_008113 [Penicillium lividum]|nr:hypothetical protein N7490_008113 [Penicillium lividum]